MEKDLTGQRFSRLVVLSLMKERANSSRVWKCKCDCGNFTKVRSICLTNGSTKSCGCYQKEQTAKSNIKLKPKPHRNTVEYRTWQGMIQRCINPNHTSWKYYGGRGITVCKRWLDSFDDFYDDLGPRPTNKHSIDRIDNDGNYEPENVKWATKKEQIQNRRSVTDLSQQILQLKKFIKQSNQSTIYLAGPLTGLTFAEASEWREKVKNILSSKYNILSPLQGQMQNMSMDDIIENIEHDSTNKLPINLTATGITSQDEFYIRNSDIILANFIGAKTRSLGTAWECGFAWAQGKQIISVIEPGSIHDNPFMRRRSHVFVPTLEEAIEYLNNIAI